MTDVFPWKCSDHSWVMRLLHHARIAISEYIIHHNVYTKHNILQIIPQYKTSSDQLLHSTTKLQRTITNNDRDNWCNNVNVAKKEILYGSGPAWMAQQNSLTLECVVNGAECYDSWSVSELFVCKCYKLLCGLMYRDNHTLHVLLVVNLSIFFCWSKSTSGQKLEWYNG